MTGARSTQPLLDRMDHLAILASESSISRTKTSVDEYGDLREQ
jgi:hypothetical protein